MLYACRDAGVPVVITLHNYKLLCASGDFFRDGEVCHDCAGGNPTAARDPPLLPRIRAGDRDHGAERTRATGAAGATWSRRTSSSPSPSAALLAAMDFDPDRTFVKHNLVPYDGPVGGPRRAAGGVRRPARRGQGRTAADEGLGRVPRDRRVTTRCGSSIAGGGPMLDEVTAWAAERPSVELRGMMSKQQVLRADRPLPGRRAAVGVGGDVRAGGGRGDGGRRTAARLRPRFVPRTDHRRRRRRAVRAGPPGRAGQAAARRRHVTRTGTTNSAARPGRRTRRSTTPAATSSNCSTSTGSPSPPGAVPR